VERQLARNICGAMMFQGDNALKKIDVLSGGEKSRVMLGKLLAQPSNLLLLDEPTNHLDMESCDALLSALDNFPGAVIMVTHNEMFLHLLAEKLVVFQGEQVMVFHGTYSEFLEKVGWQEEDGPERQEIPQPDETPEAARISKKEARKRRSEIITEKNRVVKPLEKKMAATEKGIEVQEEKLQELNQAMLAASQTGDGEKIAALSKEIHACQTKVDGHFETLEKLMSDLEEKAATFDRQIEALGGE
jgi:ATP-binding cassette subfamily F protein 3